MNHTEEVVARLLEMDRELRASATQNECAPTGNPEGATAKFPGEDFSYLEELAALPEDPGPTSREQLLRDVAGAFRGAQRSESKYCVFNLNVLPTVESTAAACLSTVHNVNGLMDAFGGEMLLVEQKVARTLGRWAGWPQAMGISSTGGKVTMEYALRTALTRAAPGSMREGLNGRYVVLCNDNAHYSIEHVAALVGIGSSNCVRVPTDADGMMARNAILEALNRAMDSGSTVVAVVAAGGTTIDFACDDLNIVADAIDEFVETRDPCVRPLLHCDAVIGWVYLATSQSELPTEMDGPSKPAITIRRRLDGLSRFDSFGADFHKTGLCPYSSSFFVARNYQFMNDLGVGDYEYGPEDFAFGQFRAYRYTAENTRPVGGILSAWVNLRSLGRQGLRNYFESVHANRADGERALRAHGRFRILNERSLGWEIVFDDPALARREDSGQILVEFVEHCWNRVLSGERLPLISVVPDYNCPERTGPALLIYPIQRLTKREWTQMYRLVSGELDQFLATHIPSRASIKWNKPIR